MGADPQFDWSVIKAIHHVQDHTKSDERILGDGDINQSVMDEAKERLKEHYRLGNKGMTWKN